MKVGRPALLIWFLKLIAMATSVDFSSRKMNVRLISPSYTVTICENLVIND